MKTPAWISIVVTALLVTAHAVHAQPRIRPLTGVITGHLVGGVTVDLVGNIYVADFGDIVWKISPEGDRQVFATGLYGTSGNAIARALATSGLDCPVGIAVSKQRGEIFVANCRSNSIARVAADGAVTPFAQSELFNCPNGLAFDDRGALYVANFRDNRILKIEPSGAVALFATASKKGLGHLCFKHDRLYVTAYASHELYEVAMDGTARRLLGTGERGVVDGADPRAKLSFPNGIACDPWTSRLYINESMNDSEYTLPRRTIVRVVELESKS